MFETDEDRLYFMVTLYAKVTGTAMTGRAMRESGTFVRRPRAERREVALAFFRENPNASIAAASQELQIPSATLNRDIAALRKEGKLAGNARVSWTVSE